METMAISGNLVNIGETPAALKACGFANREEVESVAIRFSDGKPFMKMDDVAEYFLKTY